LPLGNVAVGLNKDSVVFLEEEIEVDGEIARNEVFVASEELLFTLLVELSRI
jgi:hypothetical protein